MIKLDVASRKKRLDGSGTAVRLDWRVIAPKVMSAPALVVLSPKNKKFGNVYGGDPKAV